MADRVKVPSDPGSSLPQPLQVGEKSAAFARKHEVRWSALTPPINRFGRGQSVKRGVELDSGEDLGVPSKPLGRGEAGRIQNPPPMAVEVTARAYQQRAQASPQACIRISWRRALQ